ncbi:hypothetical protein [Calothrix rhizosoleniae]|uniref:hypothetical protein n=1 Tax=Calothrix rhizosoleniae TaxID=888997 RepID=UPI0013563E91|nr:hypothetical protein [Calothrix rhizosoleniae]
MSKTSVLNKNKNHKSMKNKQRPLASVNIGSPLKPVRKRQEKTNSEVLTDWAHAS